MGVSKRAMQRKKREGCIEAFLVLLQRRRQRTRTVAKRKKIRGRSTQYKSRKKGPWGEKDTVSGGPRSRVVVLSEKSF